MGKAIENLKKTESTKEAQVIADTGKTHEEKKESLEKIMKGFLEGWPGQNFHDLSKCSLPSHPCCVQVLEKPPSLSASDERVIKDRRIYPGLASLAIDMELMLGDRPKYTCMEKC